MTAATAPAFRSETNVRLLYMVTVAMGVQPHMAIWILYLLDFRGLTLAQVGIMEGVFWAMTMILEVPTGAFADRYGRKLSFLAAATIEGAGILAFAFAANFPLLLLSYILWAIGLAFGTGNAQAFLYDSLAAGDRATDYSKLLGRVNALRVGATMCGGVAGGLIAGAVTLQTPIFVAVGAYFFAGAIVFRMEEPPRRAAPDGGGGLLTTMRTAGGALRNDAAVRYIIIFQIALMLAMIADYVLTQPFLEAQAVPVALFGVMAVPARLASMGGAVVAYRVAAGVGLRRAAGLSLVAVVAALSILGIVDHIAAFAALVASQASIGLAQPAVSAYINDRTESHIRATVMSVIPLGMALCFAIAMPLVGLAADASLRLAFGGLAAAVALIAGGAYLLWLRADERSPQPAQEPERVAA